jgi:hypothetical protein
MNGGCDDRRLVEVFQEHVLWQALLSEVLNLWILLPENNLLSGLFGWLVGLWTVGSFEPSLHLFRLMVMWPRGRNIPETGRSFENFACDPVSGTRCRTAIHGRGKVKGVGVWPAELSWRVPPRKLAPLNCVWFTLHVWCSSDWEWKVLLAQVCSPYQDRRRGMPSGGKLCWYLYFF